MDIGSLHLSVEAALWLGFLFFGGLLIVFRDWWVTLPALLAQYVLLCLLQSRFPFVPLDLHLGFFDTSPLVLVKAVTGLAVVSILAVTVVSRRRLHLPEDEQSLDEITAARLRWAARRVARREGRERFRLSTYLLPTSILAVLMVATYTLAVLYPIAQAPNLPASTLWFYVDLVWYWLGLSGLFIVLFAQEVQEVSVGLLLCCSSVDLLYTALSHSVGLVAIGLLSAVSILLAVGSAYLAQLFYQRLRRWQLPSAEEWD